MTKGQANDILSFIRKHYDMVGQEDWFDLCDMLFGIIEHDMNQSSWGASLAEENPDFFEIVAPGQNK